MVNDRAGRGASQHACQDSVLSGGIQRIHEYSRDTNLTVNICREKKLTNIRAAGRDENILITPHREMGLEAGIEWIGDDELVEITPQSIRVRKRVLKQVERK